jgi:hypothetical protein
MAMNKKQNAKQHYNQQNQQIDLGECLATNHIVEDKLQVGFMYREVPEDEFDSGWRFLSGNEDDDYMNDADNYRMVTVEFLLSLDPAVRNFLNRPVGTELERVAGTNRFEVYSKD